MALADSKAKKRGRITKTCPVSVEPKEERGNTQSTQKPKKRKERSLPGPLNFLGRRGEGEG